MDPEYVSKTSRKIKVHIVDIKTGKLIQKEGKQTKKKGWKTKAGAENTTLQGMCGNGPVSLLQG